MTKFILSLFIAIVPLMAWAADSNPAARAFYQYDQIHQPVLSKDGMVSAQDAIAARVGAIFCAGAAMRSMRPWPLVLRSPLLIRKRAILAGVAS